MAAEGGVMTFALRTDVEAGPCLGDERSWFSSEFCGVGVGVRCVSGLGEIAPNVIRGSERI